MSENSPDETFRATMRSCTPNGKPHTVRGLGNSGRVCLTFNRTIRTTVVMTTQETAQLCELLNKATEARHGGTGTVAS
ncbi:MAG: hypothetical protein WBF75_24920 [Pseudonocardiaceae bacterium]